MMLMKTFIFFIFFLPRINYSGLETYDFKKVIKKN